MNIESFLNLVKQHSKYRNESINLIASENYTSPLVKAMLSTDLGSRYSAEYYGGTKFIQKIINKTESFIRDLFNADYAIISALSGNLCVLASIFGFTKFNEKILVVEAGENGGYPLDYEFFGRKKITFDFSKESMNILIEENINKIKQQKPKLVIFGASFIPFPEPVNEIIKEFEKRKTIHFAYDGSHVLGLIAGKTFQNPLVEGAHVLLGSTHKSFPGPQGGIILTNDMERYDILTSILDLDLEKGIRLVDNNHPNRIAALGVATLEMIEYGEEYAQQIVKNSKALANSLSNHGVPVKFKKIGFTESHQVIINTANFEEGSKIKERAEKIGLMIDAGIRLGTSEVTRMGMKELEMKEIGEIFAKMYFDEITSNTQRRINDLANLFSNPIFCFENSDELMNNII
ncbi:MAG TPA: serine hydroxymethyltransferase [candidate division Zixibacteria bacterium]|nr:serine hydroxymethyltransferase [candidate division Zixibacteria bacterium]